MGNIQHKLRQIDFNYSELELKTKYINITFDLKYIEEEKIRIYYSADNILELPYTKTRQGEKLLYKSTYNHWQLKTDNVCEFRHEDKAFYLWGYYGHYSSGRRESETVHGLSLDQLVTEIKYLRRTFLEWERLLEGE